MNELLVYTELCGGKYRIEDALGCDDTSCTYLASDSDGKNFVIKEFFVSDMCSRNGNEMLVSDDADSVYIDELRSRFRDFSVALMSLHYPSLVPVVDCFSENNTCYFVMEHIKGKTLRSFSPMTKTEALPVVTDVLEAVKFLHDHKIPHLNLSPDNIIRRESGARPYLVGGYGFCRLDLKSDLAHTDFLPIEAEFKRNESFNPQWDIYSLGALYYYMLLGQVPSNYDVLTGGLPDDELRSKDVSISTIETLASAVNWDMSKRPKSVGEFWDSLKLPSGYVAEPKTQASDLPKTTTKKPRAKNNVADPKPVDKPRAVNESNEKVEAKGCLGPIILLLLVGWFLFVHHNEQKSTSYSPPKDIIYSGAVPRNLSAAFPDNFVKMVLVEGGRFNMGYFGMYSHPRPDELPTHTVDLNSFYIASTEVTQRFWVYVMGSNPSHFKGDFLPVDNITWNDAMLFIEKLNHLTGRNYRLPTESEWEYAAMGGKKRDLRVFEYVTGGVWDYYNAGETTHSVGKKTPNPLGLYDMCGNVSEWVSDYYGPYPSEHTYNPQGPSTGDMGVARGGSINNVEMNSRVTRRYPQPQNKPSRYIGLRLAMSKE
ncbi:MAG: SUMF1/EgtB/PvdO family nonheme iron enzyme [Bacteroidales bacterium]|nr:SUMF1/EgtB/PvdO family nonheme iron enzyme [Bacteroidales bacterium]